jgi:hypothetical protein
MIAEGRDSFRLVPRYTLDEIVTARLRYGDKRRNIEGLLAICRPVSYHSATRLEGPFSLGPNGQCDADERPERVVVSAFLVGDEPKFC